MARPSNKREREKVEQSGWPLNTSRTSRKLAGGRSRRNDRDRWGGREGKRRRTHEVSRSTRGFKVIWRG